MPGSKTDKAVYFGRAIDVGGCTDKIAVDMHVKRMKKNNNVLTEFNFTQMYPIGSSCAFVTGTITFDMKTVDFKSNRDSYFVLPANCTNASPSWCPTIYYSGNPCGIS